MARAAERSSEGERRMREPSGRRRGMSPSRVAGSRFFFLGLLLALAVGGRAAAHEDALPARIAPDAPFPRIQQEAPTIESVAPGVLYADYQLITAVGPLSVHVISVEPHRSDAHLGAVLADDSLESRGETIGSMARRTRAVAGINGDFFDIGNTNRPIGLVVRAGVLVQLPYKRYALAIAHDGTPHIAEFNFTGQIEIDQRTMPLDGIDEMPANGGLSLLTPFYGRVRPQDDVTLVKVEPLSNTPPLTNYRVVGVANNLETQPPGYYVAIGLNDYGFISVPDENSILSVTGDLSPLGLNAISSAVGGGALILHDGAWYDDADAPYRVENVRRMPCSGAAIAPNGRLFLVEVDGRQPEESVGVTRPEFAALMRALGATEGLLFDGGGSSTLVARRLGESDADVMNSPSDGRERPVADGILVYSTAPAGPPIRLVARPGAVRALPGAEVPLRIAAVDAANHVTPSSARADVVPPTLGEYRDGEFVALRPGSGRIVLRDANLHGSVPVEIAAAPARTRIMPARPNVDPNATIALSARAYDRDGYALALPPNLRWSASSGSVDARGQYRAASHNARISVRIGGAIADTLVTVGSHEIALAFADHARFTTVPHGGTGLVAKDAGCRSCVALSFSFGATERAAYATTDLPLPAGTIGLTFDLRDDGSDARVRVNVRNAINEDTLVQAADLGQPGWRTVVVRFPPDTDAARLISIYVLRPKGIELSEGTIVLRNVRAIVAGQ
jgi:hypothetical protein